MKKLFQLVLILFLTTTSTTSYAFIGKIKALQGIGLFFKTKVFKLGAATEGARVIDNVATEALNFRKIDKKLINKLSNQKEIEILQTVKETPDEAIISNYKNIDDTSLSNDADDWWRYLHPGHRHLAKDVKPENFIYACETNSGDTYYFSLLPKRNLALVSSSVKMIGTQRLKIRSSSAKGTVLINLDSNGTTDYFFLLPNYKFYAGKQPSSGEFEILPNGTCYNTEINFDKNEIKFAQYQVIQKKREPSFIEKNLINFAYLIFIWIVWSVLSYFIDKTINKDEKKMIKFFNVMILSRVLHLVFHNLLAIGFFLVATSNLSYEWYIEFLWWGMTIYFLYLIFDANSKASKDLKECKLWTKADFGKIGEFRYKLFHRLAYYNIWVLTAFVLGYLFL
ncbi:hypothetical protein [Candidatus Pelagibacter sp.]|uniref:hypothetical protein n=1 Tax=Candidatus Pelagibacter sp. TaxID=2024849 RepID=UPI003F87C2DF